MTMRRTLQARDKEADVTGLGGVDECARPKTRRRMCGAQYTEEIFLVMDKKADASGWDCGDGRAELGTTKWTCQDGNERANKPCWR